MRKPTTAVPSHAKLALVQVLQKEQLGRAIKARREQLGLSQKELAERAHVREAQTVSRWERGKNEPEDLPAVARALEWTVAEMMRGIEPINQADRRRLDPEGGTQLDRIERMMHALVTHFDVKVAVDTPGATVTDLADAVDPPPTDDGNGRRRKRKPRRPDPPPA